jgi:hypothetical protein
MRRALRMNSAKTQSASHRQGIRKAIAMLLPHNLP